MSITRLTVHNSEIMIDLDELVFSVPTSARGAQWAPPPRTEGHTSVEILAVFNQQLKTPENGCPEAVLYCAPLWSLTVKQMGSKEASAEVVVLTCGKVTL